MKRLIGISCLLVLLVGSVFYGKVLASEPGDGQGDLVQAYGNLGTDQDSDMASSQRPGTPAASLGTATADGGSPGQIVGRTQRDELAHLHPGRMVDWRYTPNVHFASPGQYFPGTQDPAIGQWVEYTMFDPTYAPNGVFLSTVWVQPSPLTTGGWQPNLDVDETGHAILVCEEFDPSDPVGYSTVFWDWAGAGSYGTFAGDPLPQSLSIDPTEYISYPQIEYQEYEGKTIVHVLALEDSGDPTCDMDAITYWRQELDSARSYMSATWETMLVTDFAWSNQYDISTSRDYNGNVGIAWIEWPGWCNGAGSMDGVLHFMESSNGGMDWGPDTEITDLEMEYLPWVDIAGLYDTDGYLHLVFSARPSGADDPSRVLHWSNWSSGPYGGGDISVVTHVEGSDFLCGRGEDYVANTAMPMISQCDYRLYVTWTQYGWAELGDSVDCADEYFTNDSGTSRYNADIYMSVSSFVDGHYWDYPRNLTNSHTPGCDGTEGNNCDHDSYGSMSRYGMNTSSMGTTYWSAASAAFDVRDELDNSYPDYGRYIDFQYINDLFPDPAEHTDDQYESVWTYNPIKWFRIPCVPPVLASQIYLAQDHLSHPGYWVHNGEITVEDILIENFGNVPLEVLSIVEQVDQPWLTVLTGTPFSINEADSDLFQFEIDASSFSGGTTTELVAELVITSDDPNHPEVSFFINTIAADTVVQVQWDTVSTAISKTAYGPGLTVASNGNAGNNGVGDVNLDFAGFLDCDPSLNVYLNDLTPIIMMDEYEYSWQPQWSIDRAESYNFQPVVGDNEPGRYDQDGFEMYYTGTFVSSDSTVALEKYFVAPSDDSPYIIERWDIYSYDGYTTHNNVRLGEWINWDIPTGNNSNEGWAGVTSGGVTYVYQQGEIDPMADPLPCLEENWRLGGSGLLGYYTTAEYTECPDMSTNHEDLWGGFVLSSADLQASGTRFAFDSDSVWSFLSRNDLDANNSEPGDKQSLLSFGEFDISPYDTLHIWTVHASVYDGDEYDLEYLMDEARAWYLDNRCDVGFGSSCACGDINCDGNVGLSDITKLIDILYVNPVPVPYPEAAEMDGCPGIDLGDVWALIYEVYITHLPGICVGDYNCDHEVPGDSIDLVAAFWPHDHVEYEGNNRLELDMWVRNTMHVSGVQMTCTWDNPKLSFDSAVTAHTIDTGFYRPGELFGYVDATGDNPSQSFQFVGFSTSGGLDSLGNSKWLWAKFYFTVDNWDVSDVINIELSNLKMIDTLPGGEFLQWVPHWSGDLVIRDGLEQCCGIYAGGTAGNTNCSYDGKITLSDITRLIDKVYISEGLLLCCRDNGELNNPAYIGLSDITRLIDFIYVSKIPPRLCD